MQHQDPLSLSLSKAVRCGLLMLLAGCSGDKPPIQAVGDEHIACALNGASEFAPNCAVERAAGEGGTVLTVRHPDGGFRRFSVTTDGRGIVPADGAQRAATRLDGSLLEIAVDRDRYRFPVTVSRDAARH